MHLHKRLVVDEIMDGPSVNQADHAAALAGLARINFVSRAVKQMTTPILKAARQAAAKRITMLDIACGGGDVAIGIAKAVMASGIEIDLSLLDRSDTALKLAATQSCRVNFPVRTFQANLLDEWFCGSFDVVTCSLFLHHLREPGQVVDLLRRMRATARRQIVISDLDRCASGLAAAWIGSRLLSRSPIVHFDAPASVRAAWRKREIAGLADQAGLKNSHIASCWPWRFLLNFEAAGDGT